MKPAYFRIHIILSAALLTLCSTVELAAQKVVTGRVYLVENDLPQGEPGIAVYYRGTDIGTITDPDGFFTLPLPDTPTAWLEASFLGFKTESILVDPGDGGESIEGLELYLRQQASLDVIVIEHRRGGTAFSRLATQKMETITGAGLMRMACCNLSESFENSATVTVGFTDAVSGAKQVQLLGLSGIYTQMMDENIPTQRGLGATYGWSYTPGPWLESIQISKGASSVVNGYESVAGQINLEFKKPDNTEDLFINLYGDESARLEANITSALRINDKLSTGLMLHGSAERRGHDANHDGFLDQPRTSFFNVYNRWMWIDPERGIESRTGVRFLYDNRQGGQTAAAAGGYATDIGNRGVSVFNKTGLSVGDRQGQSLGIISSYTHHRQDSKFGLKSYDGRQNTLYLNTLFSSYISNTSHKYTAGASFSLDDINATYSDALPFNATPETRLDRREAVVGAYAQYTYEWLEKVTLLGGVRADYNSRYGWLYTPRVNLRYSPAYFIIFRASAGKGYRSANVIADNIGLMASSRNFHVGGIDRLDIERAWNYGANLSFHIPVPGRSQMAVLSFDYFHTDFQNQAILDMERSSGDLWFYNLDGRSYADAWQADLLIPIASRLELFTAFRYNDTRITYTDTDGTRYRKEKPLTSRYRGLVTLSFSTPFRKWVIDATAQFNGPSRLPGLAGYSSPVERSPFFPVYFLQVTKNTRRFDVYVGAENILDYRQKNPILGADDPFGQVFDSSRIWGPLMGRKIYAGIRLRIGQF